MSILPGAHDVVITGGEFFSHQTNLNLSLSSSQSGIDVLLEAATPEAAVDSGERDYDPSCFPGTRDQHIEDITNWAAASNGDCLPIYWMNGPAGVGKSAIARTCAQKMKDTGRLGAAFFFSINGRRKYHARFFPTLAYQLSTILDDYREIVNLRVVKDKTLVTKTMKTQFESLIVQPLQELKQQGKEVRMRPIFIDGLDECENVDAQVEIIEIIAASVQAQSTPFRWAIFSRAEPRIASTFKLSHISPHCRLVYLPISRDCDREIETYLRGGFENILRRRDMVLSSPWPTDEDIQKLIDAAAGLFAYCATVLRFIDTHSFSGFKETLQGVLEVIANPRARPIPLYADLDRVYILVLQRVPEDILPSILLWLGIITIIDFKGQSWDVATLCNQIGVSKTIFKKSFHVLDPCVDLTRSYWEQSSSFSPSASLRCQILRVHGTVSLFHKSFHDFLRDPDRSSTFCVNTDTMRREAYAYLAQQHRRFASSYNIQRSRPVLASGVTSSSTPLSFPQGTEFVDSYLKLRIFCITSFLPGARVALVVGRCASSTMQVLTEFDYYKSLIAERMLLGSGLHHGHVITYQSGNVQLLDGTAFRRISAKGYDKFDLAGLLAGIKIFESSGVIRAFRPRVPSAVASMCNSYSRNKSGKLYGLYELGRGEKSVVWYWECHPQQRYYHEFHTVNYAEAMRIYKTEKFKMWKESWVPPS